MTVLHITIMPNPAQKNDPNFDHYGIVVGKGQTAITLPTWSTRYYIVESCLRGQPISEVRVIFRDKVPQAVQFSVERKKRRATR